MKRIIIKGAGFVNKGAEAMLMTVQSELTSRISGLEFALWRTWERYWPITRSAGLIPLLIPYETSRVPWKNLPAKTRSTIWGIASAPNIRKLKQACIVFRRQPFLAAACKHFFDRFFPDPDCVLDISGFAYGDVLGTSPFSANRPLLDYCREYDKPFICLPQAWGSYKKHEVAVALRDFLGSSQVSYFSRDNISARHLEEAMNLRPGSVPVFPDIAFSFRDKSEMTNNDLLLKLGISGKRQILGIAPNMRVYERSPGRGESNSYLKVLIGLIRHVLEDHDLDIVLQANEIDPCATRMDDRYLCKMIHQAVARPERCFLFSEYLSAAQTKALISGFSYLIASRYHSLVFALSQGIPCQAVSWSHKYQELFALFGLEDEVLDHASIKLDNLIHIFEKGWADRSDRNSKIKKKLPGLQRQNQILFDEVAEAILKRS